MKALILNSGLGHRMGALTKEHPKCMTDISSTETILSRQLRLLAECGVNEVVMTTGYYNTVLEEYCASANRPQTKAGNRKQRQHKPLAHKCDCEVGKQTQCQMLDKVFHRPA